MPVDVFKPESTYKGQDRQEWNRLRTQLKAQTAAAPPPPAKPLPFLPYAPASSSRRSNNVQTGASEGHGTGLVSALMDKLMDLASEVVDRVTPLRACVSFGEGLANASALVRRWTALSAAILTVATAVWIGTKGSALLLALCFGALVGWFLPSIVGGLLVLATHLVGLSVVLLVIAIAIGAIVFLVRASVR